MRDAGWFAHPAEPRLPGLEVSRRAAPAHRLAVDLAALPQDAHRVNILLAPPVSLGWRRRSSPSPVQGVTKSRATPSPG